MNELGLILGIFIPRFICLQFGFNEKLVDSHRSSNFYIIYMYFEARFLF